MKIGFGGGCHWCTEAVYQSLRGIERVDQGFVASVSPDDTFSEAVIVEFDPIIIPREVLIEIHLRTHASMSEHSMRKKYRSAIYVFSDEQGIDAQRDLKELQRGFDKKLITRVLLFASFKHSEDRYKNYYQNKKESPFSQCYIDPKIGLLRKEYGQFLN